MAREHVTVALSGDAGDELFGGYTRYFTGAQNWRRISRLPMSLRRAAAGAINALAPETWEAIYKGMSPLLPSRFRVNLSGDKLHKLAGALDAPSGRAFYERLRSVWPDASVVPGETDQSILPAWTPGNRCSLAEYMMAMDAVTYLPDDILVKVDRAAMSVSLETRVPMLDHRVVEFAWDLPLRFKIRDGQGKWALRQVLHRYVPATLLDRPKMGFAVPIDQWLRGPLRDWAESLLQVGRLQDGGLLAAGPIRTKWIEHLDGTRNWQYPLWNVLMFQAWREQWSPAA
jgi:asparagine synthase (glutamine-hydrolysing)